MAEFEPPQHPQEPTTPKSYDDEIAEALTIAQAGTATMSPNEREMMNRAAQASRTMVLEQPQRTVPTEPVHESTTSPGMKAGVRLALTGMVVAGVAGLTHSEGGADLSNKTELDPAITSITLRDATLRYDPFVDKDNSGNVVAKIDGEVTISTDSGVRVEAGTNNGTWYGIDPANIPNFDAKSDNDHIIWVNEQGVVSMKTSGSSETLDVANN